jgi:lysyl-tRNA synthetase class 2
LRISTELYQKRLIGGGFEKVFTLGPNFRNEGMSDEHYQEYYQLEWYWAYADYRDNMELVKELIKDISKKVYGKTKFTTRGYSFDLNDEWQIIDYQKIIKEKFNIDIFISSEAEMKKILNENNIN